MKIYYDKRRPFTDKRQALQLSGTDRGARARAEPARVGGERYRGLAQAVLLAKAEKAGLKVQEVGDAVKGADFVMMLMPDEHIARPIAKMWSPT
jgi:ketol-acid reductoisomerase